MTTRSSGRIGILFLDVEGGWGGSSRSLFHLIEALDRGKFQPLVALRKKGPVEARYESLGVSYHHAPGLAAFRPSERKNIVSFALFLWGLRHFPGLLRRIRALVVQHDVRVIHVNHESLALSGYLLSKALGLPWLCHNRTSVIPSWFARRLQRLIAKDAAHAIFISGPVFDHFKRSVGNDVDVTKSSIIFNIAPLIGRDVSPAGNILRPPDRFRVLSLTNFSPNRGVDRIVDVAEVLRLRGDRRFAFYLCGQPANVNPITGRVDPYFDSIRQRVDALGLQDTVFFHGHVDEPERALVACDALIKLTRQANPWGRDAMEALAAGLPVITLGTFQGFVENKVNGYISEEFDPESIADYLQQLAGDPSLRRRIAAENKAKAERMFSPTECARATEAIYRRVLGLDVAGDKASKPCVA